MAVKFFSYSSKCEEQARIFGVCYLDEKGLNPWGWVKTYPSSSSLMSRLCKRRRDGGQHEGRGKGRLEFEYLAHNAGCLLDLEARLDGSNSELHLLGTTLPQIIRCI